MEIAVYFEIVHRMLLGSVLHIFQFFAQMPWILKNVP